MKLKQNKNKLIAAAIIIALLAGAWLYGGNYSKTSGETTPATAAQPLEQIENNNAENITAPPPETTGTIAPTTTENTNPTTQPPATQPPPAIAPPETTPDDPNTDPQPALPSETPTNPDTTPTPAPDTTTDTPPDPNKTTQPTDPTSTPPQPPANPDDTPATATATDDSFTVTLTIRCDTLLSNIPLLNKEKQELVPDNGVIFPVTTVTAYEGESVFNILLREMKRAKIHMAFRNTPIYNSAYIEAINNLYELDAGELSGWMYCVNGVYPNYGCSRYQIQPGDAIEWRYTCDQGRDLGQTWITGWQY